MMSQPKRFFVGRPAALFSLNSSQINKINQYARPDTSRWFRSLAVHFSITSSSSHSLRLATLGINSGNWKCNGSIGTVEDLCDALKNNGGAQDKEVVVAPPSLYLQLVQQRLANSPFAISAQNCSAYDAGAYTGEISAGMLEDMRIPYVILGHSERRSLFDESPDTVGRKTAQALAHNMKVVACIGETLLQRESGEMYAILEQQLNPIKDAAGDQPTTWSNIVIAYEPVWAIGTGVVASPQQAQDVHEFVRSWIAIHVSKNVADNLRIIYGGSVNATNCGELKSMADIDGFLVGGASLKADEFVRIIQC